MQELIHGGSTVLMVSHGIGTILKNCKKVVWIEKGKLQMVGNPTLCAYIDHNIIRRNENGKKGIFYWTQLIPL